MSGRGRTRSAAWMRAAPGAIAVVTALALLWAGPAGAHGPLVGSDPSPGHTVSSVDRIVLEFADPLDTTTAQSVSLTTPSGVTLALPVPDYEDGGRTMVIAAPALTEVGAHAVRYEAVSSDGHLMSGEIRFTYVPGTPGPPPALVVAGALVATAAAAFAIHRRRWATRVDTSTAGPDRAGGGPPAAGSGETT